MKAVLMFLVLAMFTLVGCTSSSAEKEKIYDVKGKVVSMDVEKKTVTLDHEEIPGHMHAMKMSFDVENAKLLEGLKAGDQVQGKLRVKDRVSVITELKKQ